ncbi:MULTISPECIES: helix-turn-helix transcriptional regulator [Herbaspirillum]|uniref:helix-turn-helix transcriptional regulator n=1 Tax=Herbaspirillum TaxID=963 RepID=UPI0011BE5379
MTPFSAFLHDFCRSRGMRQKEFASHIGVDPSYLSAIINGRKNALGNSIAERIEERFTLSEEEKLRLRTAIKFSKMRHQIPAHANPEEYELVCRIMDSLGKLKAAQIKIMNEALKL